MFGSKDNNSLQIQQIIQNNEAIILESFIQIFAMTGIYIYYIILFYFQKIFQFQNVIK
jgi:hypothetical protein